LLFASRSHLHCTLSPRGNRMKSWYYCGKQIFLLQYLLACHNSHMFNSWICNCNRFSQVPSAVRTASWFRFRKNLDTIIWNWVLPFDLVPPAQFPDIMWAAIAQSVYLRVWRLGFSSRQRKEISLLHNGQTGSEDHPVGTEVFSPRVNQNDRSPASNVEVKNGGSIPPLPQSSLWRGAQLIKHRDSLTRYFTKSRENIVTCIPIARQRLGKQTPAEANASNSSTSIAK
jgi:hypothetical protein